MISDVGYGLNSLAHLALLLLLLTVRKPGVAKHLLVLATAATFMVYNLNHFAIWTYLAKLVTQR